MKRTMGLAVLLGLSILSLVSAEDPVHFADATLKAAVEDALWVADPTPTDMLNLREVTCANSGVRAITGLEYAENLQTLNLHLNQISDISPLAGLGSLRKLSLSRNQIDDLSPLSGLSQLRHLDLHGNQLSNISGLSGLANLETLILRFNRISKLSALSGLDNLTYLSVHSNEIDNISALSGLGKLEKLLLHHNRISDISALSGLDRLTALYLHNNRISSLSTLSGMSRLTELHLDNNRINSVSALSGLVHLTDLYLENNQISDISALSGMIQLSALTLKGNPLDRTSCKVHLPQIISNNPGADIRYDPCITAQHPPSVVSYPSKNVGQTSATLVGYIINDGGDYDCEVRFRYWKEGEPEPDAGDASRHTGWKPKETYNGQAVFEIDLPGGTRPRLEPACTYHYRAIAKNSAGPDQGGIAQFTTLTALYVDDNASNDPGPHNMLISDPLENGTEDHPFDSIQEAIEASHQYDTVLVREGIYYETVELMGKNIHLTGLDLNAPEIAAYPIIDANHMGTVLSFSHNEDPNCTVSGFTLTRGLGHPASAILCADSSPTVQNCLIVGNRCLDGHADDPRGGIIFCTDSSSVFESCTLADNSGTNNGAGLSVVDSQVIVTNSILWNNVPRHILVESGDDPTIVYSNIQGFWPGIGNLNVDPIFALPGRWNDPLGRKVEPFYPGAIWMDGDYHLKSQTGRWDMSRWLLDGITSACIDAGDPDSAWLREPQPNGERINLGAYGGTEQASTSD